MKNLTNYNSFIKENKQYSNDQVLNEEWYPTGPWFSSKDIEANNTITECWHGSELTFIGGKTNHNDDVITILDTLYSNEFIDDNFDCHGISDTTITELFIYRSNLKDGVDDFKEKISKYGEITSDAKEGLTIKLNKPIEIKIKDEVMKSKTQFINKLNKLDGLMGNLDYADYKDEEIVKLVDQFIDKLNRLSPKKEE